MVLPENAQEAFNTLTWQLWVYVFANTEANLNMVVVLDGYMKLDIVYPMTLSPNWFPHIYP